jgi:putative ABC transport system substrate-binding protein
MDRRTFIGALTGALIAAMGDALAQPAKVARIGFLGAISADAVYRGRVDALLEGLREFGYSEGKNLVIEFRWAEGNYDRLPKLAAELVRLNVDVLVTQGTPATLAAKGATTTIPIVMTTGGDAVGSGLVSSLARPGGNVTGSTVFSPELNAKRLALLKNAIPSAKLIAALVDPRNPVTGTSLRAMELTARSLKIGVHAFDVRVPDDLEGAFSAMVKQHVDAVAIHPDALLVANARAIADLAAKQRLPLAGGEEFAELGALIAYGVNFPAMYRRAAYFIDKILKGAKPSDLPVEQAAKFELVVNLKTAKALGITIPQSLLLRADEVIQ